MKYLIGIRCLGNILEENRSYLLFEDVEKNAFNFCKPSGTYTNELMEEHFLVVRDYDTNKVSTINLLDYVHDYLDDKLDWTNDIVGITIVYTNKDLLVNFEMFDISNTQDKFRLAVMNLIYNGDYSESIVPLKKKANWIKVSPHLASYLSGGVVACTACWENYDACNYGTADSETNMKSTNLLADLVMEYLKYGVCHCLTLIDNRTDALELTAFSTRIYEVLKSAVVIEKNNKNYVISLRLPIYRGSSVISYKNMSWTISDKALNKVLVYKTKISVLESDYLKLGRLYEDREDIKNWNLEEFLNGKDA